MDEPRALTEGRAVDAWEGLLRQATVALDVSYDDRSGPALGTGFIVAPGLIATCAHVLAGHDDKPSSRVRGRLVALDRDLRVQSDPELFFRDDSTGMDLAFLRILGEDAAVGGPYDEPRPVLLSDVRAAGDVLWTFGHPATRFRAGQSASFTYQGDSRRSFDECLALPRVHGVPVGGGYSGSPVVNSRTGAVCGMLVTSDGSGSAHLIPAADILAHSSPAREYASSGGAHEWLQSLSDDQLRAAGLRFPGPRIRAYLNAAARAAQSHPYPGASALPGAVTPPLSTVYVRQETGNHESALPSSSAAAVHGTGQGLEGIVDRREDAVLIGGPGAGKSSLLRACVIALADRWKAGESCDVVPVRVLAADLIEPRSVPEAIAFSVQTDLSAVGLTAAWRPEFFREPPMPGVRWLIMVDGLDEIVDVRRRMGVVAKLAGVRQEERPLPYQVVVASRPLPDLEVQQITSEWNLTHYTLRDLTEDQVETLAESWFRELRLPDPVRARERFLAAVATAGMQGLVRIPLIATILCQLYAIRPDQSMPTSRAEAYESLVELLAERMYSENPGGIDGQTHAVAARYGAPVLEAVTAVPGRMTMLIGRLAALRIDGATGPAIDLLSDWTEELRPAQLSQRFWRSFLADALRRTGLMVERAGDFTFVHQTVGEFLAARYLAATPDLRKATIRNLFPRRGGVPTVFGSLAEGDQRSWEWLGRCAVRLARLVDALGSFEWRHPIRSLRTIWQRWVPDWTDSYTRFVITALQGTGDLDSRLRRLAGRRHFPVCQFMAVLIADGVVVPPRTRSAVLTNLASLAADPSVDGDYCRAAAVSLFRLGDQRGLELLCRLAAEPVPDARRHLSTGGRHTSTATRHRTPTGTLVRLSGPDGLDMLATSAAENAHPGTYYRSMQRESSDRAPVERYRRLAAVDLLELDDPRGADLLKAVATDRNSDAHARHLAATEVARRDVRGTDVLVALARDELLDGYQRYFVIEELARLGDSRAVDLLTGLAAEDALAGYERYLAVQELAQLGLPSVLLVDQVLPAAAEAVEALSRWADPRREDLLAALAGDAALPGAHRLAAAKAIGPFFDERRARSLATLSADQALPLPERVAAALEVHPFGNELQLEVLSALADDPGLTEADRTKVTQAIGRCSNRLESRVHMGIPL